MDPISVSLPLDSDGFLSRECPQCLGRFKVQPIEGDLSPYQHCPYCGRVGEDAWWTPEQAEYLSSVAAHQLAPDVHKMFSDALSSSSRGGLISISVSPRDPGPAPVPPDEMDEGWAQRRYACCDATVKAPDIGLIVSCPICGAVASA